MIERLECAGEFPVREAHVDIAANPGCMREPRGADRREAGAAIRAEWLQHAAGIGGDIVVRLADRELSGRFETLDRMGRLMLRLPAGQLEAVTVGEVFARPKIGA